MRVCAKRWWTAIPLAAVLSLLLMRSEAMAQGSGSMPGAIPVLSQDCLNTQLTSILDSIRMEIASTRAHNQQIEDARRAQGWFGYVVNGVTYWGTGANDPFQTQIDFNKQRIATLNFLLSSFETRAASLAAQLGENYDFSKALALFELINTLRRVKGVPELNLMCTVELRTGTVSPKTLFVSPQQWAEHQEAITTSKDVAVAIVTSAGGLITVPLSGGAAAGSLTPVLYSALAGCVENGVTEWAERSTEQWKDSSGRTLTDEEILTRIAEGCALGAVFTSGGAAAAKETLKLLGLGRVRELIRAGKAMSRVEL